MTGAAPSERFDSWTENDQLLPDIQIGPDLESLWKDPVLAAQR
jgi:hypothetical protein